MRPLSFSVFIFLLASVSVAAQVGENGIDESPSRTTIQPIIEASTTKASSVETLSIEEGSGAQADSKEATVPVTTTPTTTTSSPEEEVVLIKSEEERWVLSKMMGRWFEAINTPGDAAASCVVRNYGGLKKKGKRFTLRKMFKGGPGGGAGGPAGFLGSKGNFPVAALFGSMFGGDKFKLESPVQNSIDFVKQVSGADEAVLLIQSSQHPKQKPTRFVKHGPEFTNADGETQYEYIIMSNKSKYPVTVLVRDLDTFKQKYEKDVFAWLQENGFVNDFKRAFNLVKTVSYATCEYTEATYEQYGM